MSVDETLRQLNTTFPPSLRYCAIPVPDSEIPGYSAVYRSACLKGEPPVEKLHHDLDTLSKLFANSVRRFPNDNCLGARQFFNTRKRQFDNFYTYQTYKEVELRKNNLASGILYLVTNHANYSPQMTSTTGKPDFTVSILSPNRQEWLLIDLATRDYSLPNTALYPTLGKDSSKFILELTESPIIFLAKSQIPKILEIKENGNLPALLIMVSLDEFEHDDHDFFDRSKTAGITLIDFRAVEKTGERNPLPIDFNPPTPDTLYTISFTSGTTGHPKGVVLTHRMAVAAVSCGIIGLQRPVSKLDPTKFNDYNSNRSDANEQICTLCTLPLAHIYQRQLTNLELSLGYSVSMLSRPEDPKFLFEDVKALRPHYLCSVPRVWNKLEAMVKEVIKTEFGEDLTKIENFKKLKTIEQVKIQIFLKKLIGFNRLKFAVTGSAPLGLDTINFLRTVLDIGVGIGYGSTESFSGCFFGDPFQEIPTSNSGPPSITVEMKLKDCSELGYSINDQPFIRGELLLRGPQMFQKYYKNPTATKEAFTDDGWYRTGDVAAFDDEGRVFIVDRVKNFFKLSQGEFITPEKIENIYLANSPMLTQIYVHGDSLKNYLVGVAGVASDFLIQFLKKHHEIHINSEQELIDLLKTKKFKTLIVKEINQHIKQGDLQGFEKIHNLHFDVEPLKIEDEVLTPTLKLKRANAKKKFKEVLKNLYDEGSLIRNEKL